MSVRRVAIVLLLLITMGMSSAGAQPSKQTTTLRDPSAELLRAQAYVEFVNYIQGVHDAEAFNTFLNDTQAFLQSLYTPPPTPQPAVQHASSPAVRNNGAHSDAWWHGVAICEQGGRNDPYFGYFSIMDGSAGGLPWDTQVAMANNIIARAGDGAWAASCQAAGYAASPSG